MGKTWLAGLGLAIAGAALADDDVARGEALMKARCYSCHSLERLQKLATKTAEDARAARWEKFLPSHGVSNAEDRKAIVAYLLEATKR